MFLFAATAIAQLVGLFVARRLALLTGITALPNPLVSTHTTPVPYLGGAGVFVPLLIGATLAGLGSGVGGRWMWSVILGAAAFLFVGTTDDWRAMQPVAKFSLQAFAATAAVALMPDLSIASRIGCIAIVLIAVNCYNLVDVMDGLLCTVGAIGAVGLLGVGLPRADTWLIALLVVALGQLFVLNRPPASIYAGDGGALALGFLMSFLIIRSFIVASTPVALASLGTVAVPALEVTLVTVARVAARRSVFRGSSDHFSLRLQERRHWSRWLVLGASAIIASLFAAWPWIARLGTAPLVAWISATSAIGLACWMFCWRLEAGE